MTDPQALALELKYNHGALRVRHSLITLGFIETPMFKGRTNQPRFIAPLIQVDTVGEYIVDTLYSCRGRNIFLPGIMRYMTTIVSSII